MPRRMESRGNARRRRLRRAGVERLEPRCLLAIVYPTAGEQYMVELYNWARANPTAAAAKYGVGLNEGPPAYAISTDPKQPLAINPYLTDAARTYAQYMINVDVFSHDADGRDSGQRMAAAGYTFQAPAQWSENAGLSSVVGYTSEVSSANLHFSSMFVDSTIGGRWHRLNIMDPGFKEVGSGIATGIWQGFNAFLSVQDFARSGNGSFLTGVAYADNNQDNFYTPGEQRGGLTIAAVRLTDYALFTTTTWSSGGYSLALPAGQYSVWGGGPALGGWVRYDNVIISDQNVKRDFRPDFVGADPAPPLFAQVVNGQLNVTGTAGSDFIEIDVSDRVYVALNGDIVSFDLSAVTSVLVLAGSGGDSIATYESGTMPIAVDGGDGNDTVVLSNNSFATVWGGSGDDTIYGSTGHDQLYGGPGHDWIYGFSGYDYIRGEDGNDHLYGGSGYDRLFGDGGDDSLFGQSDGDTLHGGAGSDYMVGGSGSDTADYSDRTGNLSITLESRYAAANDGEAGEFDHVIDDIETVFGGSGNDVLVGTDANNYLVGGGGNDTLAGGGGFDLLFGGDGNDLILAGDGAWDYIDGGSGIDEVRGDLVDVLLGVELFTPWVPPPTTTRPTRDPFRPTF